MTDALKTLEASAFFEGIKTSELKEIVALASFKHFARDELIAKESEHGDSLYMILSGRVDISVSLAGAKETEKIASLNEGELVGEMVLLGKTRRSANIKSKEAVDVLEWKIDKLLNYFEKHNNVGYLFMRNIAASIAERLANTNQVLRNVLAMPKNVIL
jgi:CRP-like cAMP-binding protein